MQINVTVDGLDAIDLTSVVGDEIAYYNPETEETEHRPRTLADIVAEKLADKIDGDLTYEGRRDLRDRIARERLAVIRERLAPIVEEALTGDIQKTNAYGERTGSTTTMRELIISEVSKVLNGKSDPYARDGQTLLGTSITNSIRKLLGNELNAVFTAEKDKVVAAVRAQAAELVAEAVKKGLGR